MEDILNLPPAERKAEVLTRMQQFQNHVPVVFRFAPESDLALKMTNTRMFVSKANRVIDLAKNIRLQYRLNSEVTLNFSTNERILPANMGVGEVYDRFKSDDCILYLKIHEISPFG